MYFYSTHDETCRDELSWVGYQHLIPFWANLFNCLWLNTGKIFAFLLSSCFTFYCFVAPKMQMCICLQGERASSPEYDSGPLNPSSPQVRDFEWPSCQLSAHVYKLVSVLLIIIVSRPPNQSTSFRSWPGIDQRPDSNQSEIPVQEAAVRSIGRFRPFNTVHWPRILDRAAVYVDD